MSRRSKDNLARAAEQKSGTFGEMMSGALGAEKPRVGWGTPRPVEGGGRGKSGTRLAVVPGASQRADGLDRLYDQVSVDKLYDALDYVMPALHSNDQSIYLHLFRRTIAAGGKTCVISLSELGRLAGVGVSGATYSVRRLEAHTPPLIKRTGKKLGKGKDQGVEIEVYWPVVL
jgi:hypothetical protein